MAIAMSKAAAEHVKSTLIRRGKGEGLRVGVKKSGCSGYAYVLDYADSIGPSDVVYEQEGVKLIVAADSVVFFGRHRSGLRPRRTQLLFQIPQPQRQRQLRLWRELHRISVPLPRFALQIRR